MSDENKPTGAENPSVPQLTNEEMVLKFLWKHQIPLQPLAVYGGLIEEGDLTFSYSTVNNKLASLVKSGDVEKVVINKDEGVIEKLEDVTGDRRAYYLITEQGRTRANKLPS